MNSLKTRIAMAAILAASVVTAASAAEDEQQVTAAANTESAQFEIFENQLSTLSAPSYTPSEHPDAKPAPVSARTTPSVFDNPVNTRSPG